MISPEKKENPVYSIGLNIVLPVIILNKGQNFISSESAPLYVLFLALSLPFLYGLKDFIQAQKINFLSLIGFLSILLTGGLALFQFEGIYFAIKEALIPLILALVALLSISFKKPLASFLIFKSSLFNTSLIQQKLKTNNTEKAFEKLMNVSTLAFSGSFVLSAILNFVIAIFVFKDIDPLLTEEVKRQILNKQVADMIWMGYVFIALPLTLITGFLFWWILKQLKVLTGLSLSEIIPHTKVS